MCVLDGFPFARPIYEIDMENRLTAAALARAVLPLSPLFSPLPLLSHFKAKNVYICIYEMFTISTWIIIKEPQNVEMFK